MENLICNRRFFFKSLVNKNDIIKEKWIIKSKKLLSRIKSPIVFISCGSSKVKTCQPIEASRLYKGSYFKICLNLARKITDEQNIYVISAKYGLFSLKDKIESYDLKLTKIKESEREEFKIKVKNQIKKLLLRKKSKIIGIGSHLYLSQFCDLMLLPKKSIVVQVKYAKELTKGI